MYEDKLMIRHTNTEFELLTSVNFVSAKWSECVREPEQSTDGFIRLDENTLTRRET